MPVIMQIIDRPPEVAGQFLKSFDHDAENGQGYGEFTADPRQAKQFPTAKEAMRFWRRQSRVRPVRGDGQPNCPLTASTVNIAPLADFLKGVHAHPSCPTDESAA